MCTTAKVCIRYREINDYRRKNQGRFPRGSSIGASLKNKKFTENLELHVVWGECRVEIIIKKEEMQKIKNKY